MQPSSPKRPCKLMNTRSKASRSCKGLSRGSKPCASIPCACKAAKTAVPLFSDTSRSPDFPPSNTATFPNFLFISMCLSIIKFFSIFYPSPSLLIFTNDFYFLLQSNTMLFQYGLAHVFNQQFNVQCICTADVHNEIGVLFRHLRTANNVAFEPTGFQQPCGIITRRISERRACTRQVKWLGS